MRKSLYITFVSAFILFGINEISAQDAQFSQVFSNPLYLNPAFAGDTQQDRLSLTHRRQWTQLDNGYVSYSLGYDHNYDKKKLGLGFSFINDRSGIHALQVSEFMTSIAKEIRLSRNGRMRVGIKGGMTNKSFDREKLLFWNEIQSGGEVDMNGTIPYDRISYFDTGIGAVFYSNKFWGGLSLSHLNRPEQSFLNTTSRLNQTFSVHAGAELPISVTSRGYVHSSFNPVIHYKRQGAWNQLDVGAYYQNGGFRFGVWYRGLPIKKKGEPDYRNVDGLIFLVGAKLSEQFQIGYSYDLTLSNLSYRSGGSHEISIVYEWPKHKRKSKGGFVPCPRF